jgi:hypothetical protein
LTHKKQALSFRIAPVSYTICFEAKEKSPETVQFQGFLLVEISGIEPLTS